MSVVLNERLGALIELTEQKNGISIKCTNADVSITIWSPDIIQVKIVPHRLVPMSHSYAVSMSLEDVPWQLKNEENSISIRTEALELLINKSPLSFRLLNSTGEMLNEDDEAFSTSWIGADVSSYKTLQKDEIFIGLGEKVGPLNRRGQAYTHWNTDAFAYGTETDPLYVSTPFYIGIHSGLCYGIFMDNPAKSHFNFGASNDRFSSFTVEAGEMNYFYIGGKNPVEIVKNYSLLTGTMPLPPKWSLGLQQCRYSYYPDHKIRQIARSYRDKKIPCDVIYYDIHYMDAYKVFTWDKDKFPEPKKLNADLREEGFSMVAIMDPGIKVEENYPPYEEGKDKDLFIKYPDATNFTADVWPGACHFPDFTNPETVDWWASKVPEVKADGIRGYWNDMNEPACWGQTIPDLIEFHNAGDKRSHKQLRNVYGMQMARATYEGGLKADSEERPFVLTRAAYSGIQRYAAVWTGDNVAEDDHMLLGVRLVNSLGLVGIPFSGYDVGGFCGETSPQLMARWFSIGAFSPFFRCHKMINSADSEPWSYGEQVEEICRNYANLRYRLMSYIYTAFHQAATESVPVQRSLSLEYYRDALIYDERFQNQYLLGSAIMVCPVASSIDLVKVYLPETEWYYLYNDKKYESGIHTVDCPVEHLPLFAKAGSIIPENSLIQHTQEKPNTELIIHLYRAASGSYRYTHYEDDDISFRYKKEAYYKCEFIYDSDKNQLEITKSEGTLSSHFKSVKVLLHGWKIEAASQVTSHRFIEPISIFDPFMTEQDYDMEIKSIAYIEAELTEGSISLEN